MIPTISLNDLLYRVNCPTVNFFLPTTDLLKTVNGNISNYELFVLSVLIGNTNSKYNNILELGTFNGRTTLAFCFNTTLDSKIYTVDLPPEKTEQTRFPLEHGQTIVNTTVYDELGYIGSKKLFDEPEYKAVKGNIKQIWKDTGELTPEDLDNNIFDFVFVDASHSYENVKQDATFCSSITKKNGLILFHDYGDVNSGWFGVYRALNEFCKETNKEMYHIEHTSLVIMIN